MSPDVAGLCVDHEDGFKALAEGVQLRSVTHPGEKKKHITSEFPN
jgi:hypothetical protein